MKRIFSYNHVEWLKSLFHSVYNIWIRKEFNCGNNVRFGKGLRLYGGDRIHIGDNTEFGKNGNLCVWFYRQVTTPDDNTGRVLDPSIKIGNDCSIGDYFNIHCVNNICIGNNVLIGRWVSVIDNDHGRAGFEDMSIPPKDRVLFSKGPVSIGDNVWIGDKVSILSGVSIGDGAIIGANTVVTKDVPPFSVVCGSPARIIKQINAHQEL